MENAAIQSCRSGYILMCIIVKLRSRSGEGQVRVRKVNFGPELYNIFEFTTF